MYKRRQHRGCRQSMFDCKLRHGLREEGCLKITASAPSLAKSASAASTSSAPRTNAGAISMPPTRPASWTCSRKGFVNASAGLASTPTRLTDGNISRNSSTALPAVSGPILDSPVIFPPGRARLDTRPALTGSPTETITIGTVLVACLAAKAQGVKIAAMISTFRRTRSAASSGSRATSSSAERLSI